MDFSLTQSLPNCIPGYNKALPDKQKMAALDQACKVGVKLRKNLSGKELEQTAMAWVIKSGWAKPGTQWAITLSKIVTQMHVDKETNLPVW